MDEFLQLLQAELDIIRRRLRGMAMISRGIVPNLIISQRVVNRVMEAARHFIADETGESMVGLVLEPEDIPEAMPTITILDTIAPDESVIRRSHMFEQGDNIQGDIFNWLMDNWDAYLEIGKDMNGKPIKEIWKVPLKHLGDWHKQPGYMIQPSGGDLMTALRILDDEEQGFDFLLVPIVTLGHDSVTLEDEVSQVNYFSIPMEDGTSLRMDWWYIHRDVRIFQPITPRIIPSDQIPVLTPYPWHVLDVDLMDEELASLEKDGLIMVGSTVLLWEVDGSLPLEICFIVARAGAPNFILVVTNWDYPKSAPYARVAPLKGITSDMYIYDIFEKLLANSQPIEPVDGFKWSSNMRVVDFIAAIEEKQGTRPQQNKTVQSSVKSAKSVSIPVDVEGSEGKKGVKTDGKTAAVPATENAAPQPTPTTHTEEDDD